MAADPRRPLAVVRADRAAALCAEPRLARRRAGARPRVGDLATARPGARRRPRLRGRVGARRGGAVVLAAARGVRAALPGFRRVRVAVPGGADGSRARAARAQHGALDVRRSGGRRARPAASRRVRVGRPRLARALRRLRPRRARPRRRRPPLAGVPRRRRAAAAAGGAARDHAPRGLPLAVPARALRPVAGRAARFPRVVLRRRGGHVAGDRWPCRRRGAAPACSDPP